MRFWLGDDESEVVDVSAGEVLHLPSNLPHKAEALEDTLEVDIFAPAARRTGSTAATRTYAAGRKASSSGPVLVRASALLRAGSRAGASRRASRTREWFGSRRWQSSCTAT